MPYIQMMVASMMFSKFTGFYDAGMDGLFGLLSVSLVLLMLWAVGRIWPVKGKNPFIQCLIGFGLMPLLLAAFIGYAVLKEKYAHQLVSVYDGSQHRVNEIVPLVEPAN
jgi:hypothetical protein